MLTITYTKEATKALPRMPGKVAAAIERKLATIAADPTTDTVDVKPLVGRPGLRLRVGDWRVIFRIEGDTLTVQRIAPRGNVYR